MKEEKRLTLQDLKDKFEENIRQYKNELERFKKLS